jgi:biotin carboxyl carrier protein
MVNVSVDEAGEVVLEAGDTGERRGNLDLGRIESPITGVTLEILVDLGDRVAKGQDLAVVEAMKMENTLTATVSGVIDEIYVDEGDTVYTDDALLHIDPDESDDAEK